MQSNTARLYSAVFLLALGCFLWASKPGIIASLMGGKNAWMLYLLVGVCAIYLTLVPVLEDRLKPQTPDVADASVMLQITPNTYLLYWTDRPENTSLHVVSSWKEVRFQGRNAGIACSDADGMITLAYRQEPIPFLQSRICYRVCDGDGLSEPVCMPLSQTEHFQSSGKSAFCAATLFQSTTLSAAAKTLRDKLLAFRDDFSQATNTYSVVFNSTSALTTDIPSYSSIPGSGRLALLDTTKINTDISGVEASTVNDQLVPVDNNYFLSTDTSALAYNIVLTDMYRKTALYKVALFKSVYDANVGLRAYFTSTTSQIAFGIASDAVETDTQTPKRTQLAIDSAALSSAIISQCKIYIASYESYTSAITDAVTTATGNKDMFDAARTTATKWIKTFTRIYSLKIGNHIDKLPDSITPTGGVQTILDSVNTSTDQATVDSTTDDVNKITVIGDKYKGYCEALRTVTFSRVFDEIKAYITYVKTEALEKQPALQDESLIPLFTFENTQPSYLTIANTVASRDMNIFIDSGETSLPATFKFTSDTTVAKIVAPPTSSTDIGYDAAFVNYNSADDYRHALGLFNKYNVSYYKVASNTNGRGALFMQMTSTNKLMDSPRNPNMATYLDFHRMYASNKITDIGFTFGTNALPASKDMVQDKIAKTSGSTDLRIGRFFKNAAQTYVVGEGTPSDVSLSITNLKTICMMVHFSAALTATSTFTVFKYETGGPTMSLEYTGSAFIFKHGTKSLSYAFTPATFVVGWNHIGITFILNDLSKNTVKIYVNDATALTSTSTDMSTMTNTDTYTKFTMGPMGLGTGVRGTIAWFHTYKVPMDKDTVACDRDYDLPYSCTWTADTSTTKYGLTTDIKNSSTKQTVSQCRQACCTDPDCGGFAHSFLITGGTRCDLYRTGTDIGFATTGTTLGIGATVEQKGSESASGSSA